MENFHADLTKEIQRHCYSQREKGRKNTFHEMNEGRHQSDAIQSLGPMNKRISNCLDSIQVLAIVLIFFGCISLIIAGIIYGTKKHQVDDTFRTNCTIISRERFDIRCSETGFCTSYDYNVSFYWNNTAHIGLTPATPVSLFEFDVGQVHECHVDRSIMTKPIASVYWIVSTRKDVLEAFIILIIAGVFTATCLLTSLVASAIIFIDQHCHRSSERIKLVSFQMTNLA